MWSDRVARAAFVLAVTVLIPLPPSQAFIQPILIRRSSETNPRTYGLNDRGVEFGNGASSATLGEDDWAPESTEAAIHGSLLMTHCATLGCDISRIKCPETREALHLVLRPMELNKTDFEKSLAGSPYFGDTIKGVGVQQRDGMLSQFDPVERIVLTANGNLQRVISSYYNAAVSVSIVKCDETGDATYDREVTLSVNGRKLCTAKSIMVLHSPACVKAVRGGEVGIGQLLRLLEVLPSFELLNAGRTSAGGFWRVYDLHSRHFSCRIHEEFPIGLFELPVDTPPPASPTLEVGE
ncbi:unnamed protein product [Discosporangium mesarthrocarpum]